MRDFDRNILLWWQILITIQIIFHFDDITDRTINKLDQSIDIFFWEPKTREFLEQLLIF